MRLDFIRQSLRIRGQEGYAGIALPSFNDVVLPPIHRDNFESLIEQEFGEITDTTSNVQRAPQRGLRPNLRQESLNEILPGARKLLSRRSIERESFFHVYFGSWMAKREGIFRIPFHSSLRCWCASVATIISGKQSQ